MSIISKPWKLYNAAKKAFTGGKPKTTGTEVVNPFERKKMRSDKDFVMGGLKVDLAKLKGSSKKLQTSVEDVKAAMRDRAKNKFNVGGIAKRKSNIQKIQEAFGTAKKKDKNKKNKQIRMMAKKGGAAKNKKKFPDLTGDGKVTFADILKGRGVINGKKKTKKKII